jgi:hypothetical protein
VNDDEIERAVFPDGYDEARQQALTIASLARANAELGALYVGLALRPKASQPAEASPVEENREPEVEKNREPEVEAELDSLRVQNRALGGALQRIRSCWMMGDAEELCVVLTKEFGARGR